ncbi:hypothetical protein V1525DRAFT_2163 [Lipomyces kononenkoae]|uniref:Uncharacterized protein n=1 Tax=Lipomyces kononenkoae TaxID=34357 RepID=A0ACC3TBC8_LIPKO
MGTLARTGRCLVVGGALACIFVLSLASATTTTTLAPLSQILQTESVPPDVLSIFTHYFPSSLLTDYSAVSHELSILMDSTGVTIYGGPTGYATSTETYSESSTDQYGGYSTSSAATPTAVTTTASATTASQSTLSSSVSAAISPTTSTAASAITTSASRTTTSQSTSTTTTAGAARFVGSPSCLGVILAISVACLFGTLV